MHNEQVSNNLLIYNFCLTIYILLEYIKLSKVVKVAIELKRTIKIQIMVNKLLLPFVPGLIKYKKLGRYLEQSHGAY